MHMAIIVAFTSFLRCLLTTGNPGSRPTWNKPDNLIIKEQAENTNNVYPEVPDTDTVPDVSAVHSSVEPSQSAEAVVDVPNGKRRSNR